MPVTVTSNMSFVNFKRSLSYKCLICCDRTKYRASIMQLLPCLIFFKLRSGSLYLSTKLNSDSFKRLRLNVVKTARLR